MFGFVNTSHHTWMNEYMQQLGPHYEATKQSTLEFAARTQGLLGAWRRSGNFYFLSALVVAGKGALHALVVVIMKT
jgi:hypothetical protein